MNENNKSKKDKPSVKFKPPKFNVMWIYAFLLLTVGYMYTTYDGGDP